mgnify:CR=1 FL=1
MEETTPMQPTSDEELQSKTKGTVAQTTMELVMQDAEKTTIETEPEAVAMEPEAAPEAMTEEREPVPVAVDPEVTLEPVPEESGQEAVAKETDSNLENPEPAPEVVSDSELEEPEPDYNALNREGLLAAMQELMNGAVSQIKGRAQTIRTRFNELNRDTQKAAFDAFLADGGNKDEYQPANDAVAERFYALYDQYRVRRQQYMEELEEQKKKNLEAKRLLIEELRSLVDSDEEQMRTVMDRFNDIQERWKTIGEVPRDQMNDLWQNYHFQIEQFFNKLKINRELRALDQKRNLDQKITLCERAEELIVEPSVTKAFKGLQELRAQWKEIGPVPAEQNEEIWQRFQNAANRIDERRKEYYDQRKEEFDNNLLAKQALIDKAAELTAERPQSTRQWNDITAALDELLKVWKTIGPVAREVNEEIWSKFKGMIDRHYAEKKEYFALIRDEQEANYQKKIELCLKAEAIAQREDWKKATEELLQLQQEWKEIGAVSRKVSDKVWQRFRSACDQFFAKKSEFFKERRTSENENLVKKQAIISELKEHQWGEDREANLAAIKDYQRRWAEVGFVPMADKERLGKEFRAELDRIFEQLKISAREAEETAYRERLRNIGGDAKHFVTNEKQELQERIEKLRADLNLWENNLGFLASSKQADLLKQEFEKKMQGARQQIALMQAKLRILKESEQEEKKDAE